MSIIIIVNLPKSYLCAFSEAPYPTVMVVDKSFPENNALSGAPTRDGSIPDLSSENDRHSVPTSTRLK